MIFPSALRAVVVRRQPLTHVPSASGIEWVADRWYVIGDDSPWLHVLDRRWQLLDRFLLFAPENAARVTPGVRISKSRKPDLEMLTVLRAPGEELLVAGSGSVSPQRDVAYLVRPDNPGMVTAHSLTPFYDQLRVRADVVGTGRLNLEGLAANHESICFLQRGNVTGNNAVICFELNAFLACLRHPTTPPPEPRVDQYALPTLGNLRAGFSGATFLPGTSTLLFTASVEDTTDEINDGPALGSLMGLLNVNDPGRAPCAFIEENGRPYAGKVESIAVAGDWDHSWLAVAVTDSDGGESEILEIRITPEYGA